MRYRAKHGPEWHTQRAVVDYLTVRGWHVERIIGGAFQMGLPDLYICHPKWGSRWVEVKNAARYSFTAAQKRKFPVLEKHGVGIWILTGADQDNYNRLFAAPNWRDYVKKAWSVPTTQEIDNMLEDISAI